MLDFNAHFHRAPVLLVVVHAFDWPQVERNAAIAFDAGADGLFLIAGKMDWKQLIQSHTRLSARFPGRWIGLNFLDLDPEDAFQKATSGVSGLWMDNAGTGPDRNGNRYAPSIQLHREARPELLYFGGVAFKYQQEVTDVAAAAREALAFVDVVTTSGEGTGEPPAPEKIRAMKEAMGSAPLAIASGITPENVGHYLEWADCFLVATGISKNIAELEPQRVEVLASLIHAAHSGDSS